MTPGPFLGSSCTKQGEVKQLEPSDKSHIWRQRFVGVAVLTGFGVLQGRIAGGQRHATKLREVRQLSSMSMDASVSWTNASWLDHPAAGSAFARATYVRPVQHHLGTRARACELLGPQAICAWQACTRGRCPRRDGPRLGRLRPMDMFSVVRHVPKVQTGHADGLRTPVLHSSLSRRLSDLHH